LACNEFPTTPSYVYEVPPATGDGWRTVSAEEVGLSIPALSSLVDDIRDGQYGMVHSVLIVKDGRLVFETYFPGYAYDWRGEAFRGEWTEFDRDVLHNVHSVTKSITSTLVGIAIEQGFIPDVDARVFSFFPEYAHLADERKPTITVQHLLTMTSGLEWNENDVPPGDMSNDVAQLFVVPDPIEYVLAKPAVAEPGSQFYYHSGGVNVLGALLQVATGMSVDAFARVQLFAPLGITEWEWRRINAEFVFTSGDLRLRPRDVAKLGFLFLSYGRWEGQRIVGPGWVHAAALFWSYAFQDEDWPGYGYLWWHRIYRSDGQAVPTFQAVGWGGQRCIVIPSEHMVVVVTAGDYATDEHVDEIITQGVLLALR
jgi:CubicO group peptidase (beta-lactamase class C family)